MHRSLALALPLAFSTSAAAQDLWIVDKAGGPGSDFTTLQAGVDAAADGDVLLVRPAHYSGTTIDAKSVVIVADGSGGVSAGA